MEANIFNAIHSIYEHICDLKKYTVKFLCGVLQPRDAITWNVLCVPPVGFFLLVVFFFFNSIVLGIQDAYQRSEVGCSSKMLIGHFLWQQINNVHVWADQTFEADPERIRACHGGGLQQLLTQDVFPKGDCTCSDLTCPQLGFPEDSFSKEMPGAVPAVPSAHLQAKVGKATLPGTASPKCLSGT